MLFPCSGTALNKMFQIYDNIKVGENLQLVGEELKRICNFQYEYYEKLYPTLSKKANEMRTIYSSTQKKPCSKEQFIRNLKMGYDILLEHIAKQSVKYNEKKPKKEDLELLKYQSIQKFSELLCKEVLDNFEYVIIGGRTEDENSLDNNFTQNLEKLVKCVMIWNQAYKIELEKNVRDCVMYIKKQYWTDTKEKELLIDWTIHHSDYGKDIISEMYERLWVDIEQTMQKVWRTNEDTLDNWEILEIIREGNHEQQY